MHRKKTDPISKKLIKQSGQAEQVETFRQIPVNQQGFILLNLPKKNRIEILEDLKNNELINLVNYLDPDEALDLLKSTSPNRITRIFTELGKNVRTKIESFLNFNSKTATGLMNLDYIEIDKDYTIEKTVSLVRKHEIRTGRMPTLLVVDKGFLIGELSMHRFALAKKTEKINKHIKKVHCIPYNASENKVLDTFKRHPHSNIIVLDDNKSILGIIYSDDILELIQNQSAVTLRHFAGIKEEEDVMDSAKIKVKYRYKWLIINLFTAFFAASIIGEFEETISKFVILAAYLPIVAGMGGNAATQTLAITVRGLALKEIELGTARKVVINEMIAGATNGLITGVVAGVIAFLWNQNVMLGIVLGLAMVSNLLIAGLFGTIIPLIMQKLDKDPASSATIFITTATDVFGFLAFLGLAKVLM